MNRTSPSHPGLHLFRGPLRVALFSPSMTWGGAEKVLKRLATQLAAAGVEVDLLLCDASGPNLVGLPQSVNVVDLGCSRLLAGVRPLASYFACHQPHAVMATQYHANLVAVWARLLARSDCFLVLREATTLGVASRKSHDLRVRSAGFLASRFYRAADAVVAVSEGVARDLVDLGVSAEKIRVLHNPVIDGDLAEQAKEPITHPWFNDKEIPVVLSVGRLAPAKQFDLLLRAVALARRERPMRLVILGDGEERERLESMAQDLGMGAYASFPGFVNNPYAYMARAHLYAVSSAWEGFPNTIVEAIACGLRVVSTDCPSGPREILGGNCEKPGPVGSLVPVGDAERFAQTILEELSRPYDRKAAAHCLVRYDSERAFAEYLDLLRAGHLLVGARR